MEKAIIGKKVGMTQIFDEAGKVIPVTVIQAGPCTVVQKKTEEKDGYTAVQLGFEEVPEKKLSKPEAGHSKKAGKCLRVLKEFKLDKAAELNVGDELTAIVDAIIHGTKYVDQRMKSISIGVDALPPIPQDTTDRNRTSPLAFTGNKFEFRMLGSSQSISGPNTALNTIMAEELSQFADELEGASDFNTALHDLVQRTFIQHQRIIFNGNGYENAWVEEARKRGLSNLTCTADALQAYLQPKHVELFAKHRVFTREELRARNEIHLENYCQVVGIEARTMIDMVKRSIFPAVCAFSGATASGVAAKKAVLADLDCADEEELLRRLSSLSAEMMRQCRALEEAMAAPKGKDAYEAARYYRYTVFDLMGKLRAAVDELETITAREAWPYPGYTELLFSVK